MKRVFVVILVGSILFSACGGGSGSAAGGSATGGGGRTAMSDYTSGTIGIAVRYPTDWNQQEDSMRFAFSSPQSDAGVQFGQFPSFPIGSPIEGSFDRVVESLSGQFSFGDNQLSGSQRNLAAGALSSMGADDSFAGEFTGDYSGVECFFRIVILTSGENAYQVMYYCPSSELSRFRPIFTEMENSLVLPSNGGQSGGSNDSGSSGK